MGKLRNTIFDADCILLLKKQAPVKTVKENIDIISYFLYHNLNNSLSCTTCPTGMKYVELTHVHKKDDKIEKENYRPISILPDLSKIYDTYVTYFHTIFLKFQCRFQTGYNALVKKYRKTL